MAEEIILGHWFDAGDDILEVCSVATGQVVDCEHVAYRLRVRTDGHDYLVEQQAYYRTDGPRVTWMRVLCSGYQPLPVEAGVPAPAEFAGLSIKPRPRISMAGLCPAADQGFNN